MHFGCKTLSLLSLAILGTVSHAEGASIVYQNTTTPIGAFEFNGAAVVRGGLAANIDLNELTLSAGSAGEAITSLSFIADNFNTGTVSARPTMYVWAADGSGGDPGTLLGTFVLPLESFAAGTGTISLTVPTLLTVPSGLTIWTGIGFDNDNGTSPITMTQLNAIGGLTYHPSTVGTDGPNAFFLVPGSAKSNPTLFAFGSTDGANYGWTVDAAPTATPEPGSFALLVLGVPGMWMLRRWRRSIVR
jgi:hypothetical protein